MHHNCWACALEPGSQNYWTHVPRACAPQEKPLQREARTRQLDSSPCSLQLQEKLMQDPAPPPHQKGARIDEHYVP